MRARMPACAAEAASARRRPAVPGRNSAFQGATLAEQQRFAIVDDLAVDAHPADLAGELPVLDLGAAVHDDVEARGACHLGGFFADDAELHPDCLEREPVLLGD